MCVHAKSARHREPSVERSTGRSRSTGWAIGTSDLAFISVRKFSFLIEFLNGFEYVFFTYLMKRLNHFLRCNCRARKSLNAPLQIS